mgnify:CR=1 FL=1
MGKRNGSWSKQELLLALALYASFDPADRTRIPKAAICALAANMPKTSESSIALRLANFANRDPQVAALGKTGLRGGGTHVDELLNEASDPQGQIDLQKVLRLIALTVNV